MIWATVTIFLTGVLIPVHSDTLESGEFAFMCGQLVSQQASGKCAVHLSSRTNATITLQSATESWPYFVVANEPQWISLPIFERVIEGVEFKGYTLSSSQDVFSAQVHSSLDDDTGDVVSLYPSTGANTHYLISPVDYATDGCVGYTSYYSIAALEDATTITIFDGTVEERTTVTLSRFQTYTNRTDTLPGNADVDFTGFSLQSDKPVTVAVGNRCYQRDTSDSQHSVWATIPPSNKLGTEYVAADIGIYSGAYGVKVLAIEDTTDVTVDGTSFPLDALEFLTYTTASDTFDPLITCSKPCGVLFFSKDETKFTGISASSVVDTSHFLMSSFFHVAEAYSANFVQHMFIVYDSPDGTGLILDGASLDGQAWTVRGTYTTLLTAISEGPHQLHSSTTSGFSVMIMGKLPSVGHGYSYYIGGYAESDYTTTTTAPTPTTTTTATTTPAPTTTTTAGASTVTPAECPPIPQHRIELRDTFRTRDNSDLSSECAIQYNNQLNERAFQMVADVNGRLGGSICSSMTMADMYIESPGSSFIPEGGVGLATVKFYVRIVNINLQIGEVLTCIDEMEVYLVDHESWGIPILVQEDGCPAVDFEDDYMWSNSPSEWLCLDLPTQNDELHSSIKAPGFYNTDGNRLGYALGMYGLFQTADGSNLSPVCTQEYLNSLQYETSLVVLEINDEIPSTICPNTDLHIYKVSTYITQDAGDPTGRTLQYYYLDPADTTQFIDVCTCSYNLAEIVGPHDSGLWKDPVLPIVPGCPELVFDPEEFMIDFGQWYCIDVEERKDDSPKKMKTHRNKKIKNKTKKKSTKRHNKTNFLNW